jgi:hypothetical protein
LCDIEAIGAQFRVGDSNARERKTRRVRGNKPVLSFLENEVGVSVIVVKRSDVAGASTMDADQESAFIDLMLRLIDQHRLETPEFIEAHIRAFETFGATEMADFWRDALTCYDQAFAIAQSKARGERLLKSVQ